MFKFQNLIPFLYLTFIFSIYPNTKTNDVKSTVIVGANQISKYENHIKNKRIGVVANHTSVIFKKNLTYTHLIDSLIKLDFDVKVFARSTDLEELSLMELILKIKPKMKQA